ncbi:uncharacterized protein LOC127057887 isoform X2 [Gopherus flavomarginatus]|uniref:uncharacterized protein LOC127057887 isoform X2 n=1 Tax=Gopherus flavomarginatus TaxID=286002 RepID=UPI0021CBAE99|nr:uncharacterized protein LOC127057887 isoform X2 [Gopherus flavomarginatus]
MENHATRKRVLGMRRMMTMKTLKIVHSKEAEKPVFPTAKGMFLTLDLEPVPPKPTQGMLTDPVGGEGTSAANVSPSKRLVKIRRRKKRTQDEMFSELLLSSHTDRAHQNAWRQTMSECRKTQQEHEESWRAEEDRWPQLADRRQELMLWLLEHQTDMLQRMVELQERQQEHRPPLQHLCNQLPSSPSSIASSPRRPRTRWGGPPATQPLHPRGLPKQQKAGLQISFKVFKFKF